MSQLCCAPRSSLPCEGASAHARNLGFDGAEVRVDAVLTAVLKGQQGVAMLSRPLVIALTILVSIVWAANVVVGMVYPDRHDATVNAVFAIVVGVVFGLTPKAGAAQRARDSIARRIAGQQKPPPKDDPEPGDDQ